VVGIGASAGGLEALEQFFSQVRLGSGMAYVVVQHLSPDFKSLMNEILSRRTKLPVALVEDAMLVEPDHIYLIPPKKEMIISGGHLLLSEKGRDQELSLPIDVFFRSLAQDCGSRAIAIVLSGGGSDGSRGIRAVHDAGGLVLVQDRQSAQFDGMPKTARDAGVADFVLPPAEMPRALAEHLSKESRGGERTDGMNGGPHNGMTAVYRMLEGEFGIDFTHYKPSTVTRRIERRLALSRVSDIEEYVSRLRDERDELDVLYRDLLIGVTRFFRNEQAFQVLEQETFPELLASLAPEEPLRLWVAGCATGEEVYSLAIVIHELLQKHGERPVKIFATDVHRGSVEFATRGMYDEQAIANVSAARVERYFTRRGQSYQVVPDIRQMVVFAAHNVIRDAPFTRVHFVSCRNMLIYLQPAIQRKVLGLFHFALKPGGLLFMGPSESPGLLLQDFETVDKHWRVYRKRTASRVSVDPRLMPHAKPARAALDTGSVPPRFAAPGLAGVYDTLLDQLLPPSLLVNGEGQLVHSFAGGSQFLRMQDGRQSLDIQDMVGPELKTVLFGALRRAMKQAEPIQVNGVRAGLPADEALYKVTLKRADGRGSGGPHVLISLSRLENAVAAPRVAEQPEIDLGMVSREQLAALESELSYTKENLQAAMEELETSNEELQAANEELLASNEELQSTNEELQSVNEELYSVNAEYQRKIHDLTELGNDMENLLASTDVGTIFLDRQLRIRKFTAHAAETFHLMPQDIGRPISAFSSTIEHPQLNQDLQHVLESGQPVEREVRDSQHQAYYFVRVLPYRGKNPVDGVVITLIDVSVLKAAEDALFHERYLLNSLLSSEPDAIYFKDARGRFIRTNEAMAKRLGLADPAQATGKTGFELPDHESALAVHQQDEIVLRNGQAQYYQLERRETERGVAWDLVTRLPLRDAAGSVVGIIGIFRDVTDQKRAEEAIEEAVRRRDQFLAMLSHELRNPLGAMVVATTLLKGEAPGSQRSPKLLQILERQSGQMANLLNDLLEVSRVTQGKIELRKETVDLRAVAKDAIDAVRTLIDERRLQFEVELPAEAVNVIGDAARLQQIHVNLLHNAAKYTPPGGRMWLTLTCEQAQAVLRVRDDGVGIPRAVLENVFELFVQNKRTLDRSEGGLGVGLTLVRGLVEKHGGTVSAHSDGEGKGSEFVVRLPLGTAALRDSVPTLPSAEPRSGLSVVIIEDNDDSREMLCELLDAAGFKCRSTDNGIKGLALLREVCPDVALVDIGLPGLTGLEIARAVRSDPNYSGVYMIALTGYGQREDHENALAAGFDHHLVKPVDPEALIRTLGQAQRAGGLVFETP
jgi:two-component system CheB/CheR fusion protein